MMISSEMRELARHLLAYEAATGETSDPVEPTVLRVYEKLRRRLSVFAGVAGFQSLATRALALASSEASSLSTVRVAADGSLQDPGELAPQIGIDKNQAGEGGVILIAWLLELLLIFLGEALTLSLLRDAWPDAALDDRNLKNGRKA